MKEGKMINDTIYREDAINVIEKNSYYIGGRGAKLKIAIAEIKALPSVDRLQGDWIPATWQDEHCPERLKKHKCSVCGHRAETVLVKAELVDNYYCNRAEPITEYTHKEQLSKFCPHCGARMKGVDDEIFCR